MTKIFKPTKQPKIQHYKFCLKTTLIQLLYYSYTCLTMAVCVQWPEGKFCLHFIFLVKKYYFN